MGVFKHDMVLLRGGDVRLYKRDDHEDPKWQVQFRVDGEERTLRRTTGLYDLDEAKRKALDMYDEFKFRKKYDIPVFEKTVAAVAKEFLKEQDKLVKIGQLANSMYRIYKKSLRYWSEMLPSQNINKLHETDLIKYLEWRTNYYVTGPGKDLKGNRAGVKGKPADGTLQHEVMSINKMIVWSVRKGYLQQKNTVPYKFRIKKGANVRPAFTLDQYMELEAYTVAWTTEYDNSFTIRRRRALQRLIQFMFNTGVRPPEARNLKWMDTEFFVDDAGNDSVRITVRGKNKQRTFIPFYPAVRVLRNHEKESAYTKDGDYIFGNDKGERMDNPTQQFANLLAKAGVEHDSEGKKFTLYSLRHTHITFRIKYQKMDSLLIAKNAGTSVEKIEKHYGHVVPAEFAVELASADAMEAQMLRKLFKAVA